MNKSQQQLIALYGKLYELTVVDCRQSCKIGIGSCCSPEYCVMAQQFAKESWGVDLQPTGYPNKKNLPFLGPDGCTVLPHLRPCCTAHHCAINSLGFKPGDGKWTQAYFELREQIDILEWQREKSSSRRSKPSSPGRTCRQPK